MSRMEDRVEVGQGEGGFWATNFPLAIPGAAGNEVTVRHGFFGGLKILVDGVRSKRGSERSSFLIPTSDGGDFEVTVRSGYSGISPVIVTKTNTANIGRRIEGAEWIWVGLPLLLPAYAILGQGGYIDILVGFVAFSANVRIFINDGFTVGQRYIFSLSALGLFAVIYLATIVAIALLVP
ncbi:MAG: hypothetical protein V3S32_04685 [Acidimicrobiia bacterium]